MDAKSSPLAEGDAAEPADLIKKKVKKTAEKHVVTKPHHEGHRQRLRRRFVEVGPEALSDYELLEMVLFYVFPRGDTKPIAKDMLALLGGLSGVFGSPMSSLTCVPGVGVAAATMIKLVHTLMTRTMKTDIMGKIVLQTWQNVVDYCQAEMAFLKDEQLRLLFLDNKNQLIVDEVQHEGTVNHTAIYPRKVIKRALDLGASAIIMVHNHPSGDPMPSRADIDVTRKIQEAGALLGIKLHDHIIVGQGRHVSLKAMDLI